MLSWNFNIKESELQKCADLSNHLAKRRLDMQKDLQSTCPKNSDISIGSKQSRMFAENPEYQNAYNDIEVYKYLLAFSFMQDRSFH